MKRLQKEYNQIGFDIVLKIIIEEKLTNESIYSDAISTTK